MTVTDERRHLIDDIIALAERDFLSVPRMMGDEWLTLDVTMSQLKVLLLLLQAGHLRVSDIAAALGVSQAVVTGITDRLVHRTLVERVGDPHDRRVVICRLTDEGEQLALRLSASGMERGRKLMEVMTVEELELLKETFEMVSRVLQRVKHKLGVEADKEQPAPTI